MDPYLLFHTFLLEPHHRTIPSSAMALPKTPYRKVYSLRDILSQNGLLRGGDFM